MDEIEAIARRRAELAASVQRRLGQRAARDQSAAVSSTPTPVTAPARAAVPQALPAAVASASPAAAVVAVTTPTDRDGDGGSRRDADRTDLRAPEAKRPRPGSGFDKPRDRSPAPFAQQRQAPRPSLRNRMRSKTSENDNNQRFVDTGERPQNFIQGTAYHEQLKEHPQQARLRQLKQHVLNARLMPPMYHPCDLKATVLSELLPIKFDVILIDPPMEEYLRRAPFKADTATWTWDEIANLRIEDISAPKSVVFLWVGSAEGLDEGRRCLTKWGFRRSEDIVWLKTNRTPRSNETVFLEKGAVLQHTTEHCLMGIKGMVKRAEDVHFIHANCDTDVIVSEEPPLGSTAKPAELYNIIEHFCQGRRRLELFGEDSNIRPGWITLGKNISTSNLDMAAYSNYFRQDSGYDVFVGMTRPIDLLRPQSPPPLGAPMPPHPRLFFAPPEGEPDPLLAPVDPADLVARPLVPTMRSSAPVVASPSGRPPPVYEHVLDRSASPAPDPWLP